MAAEEQEKLCTRCGWRLRPDDQRRRRCPECGLKWEAVPRRRRALGQGADALTLAQFAVTAFPAASLFLWAGVGNIEHLQLLPQSLRFLFLCAYLLPSGLWGIFVYRFWMRVKHARWWWLALALYHLVVLGFIALWLASAAALLIFASDRLSREPYQRPSALLAVVTVAAGVGLAVFWYWVSRAVFAWAGNRIERLERA